MAGSGRSGACRQLDQTWQDVWMYNRDILSASCMCIDNTAVTFQKYIGFGLSGLENSTQQNKKRADHTHALFSFSWNDIFLICFCAICGNINTDSKRKKSYQRCVSVWWPFTFADISQGHDITYRDLVNRLIDKKKLKFIKKS